MRYADLKFKFNSTEKIQQSAMRLPHHIAACLLAFYQVLLGTGLGRTVYVRKQNNNISEKLTLAEKEESIRLLRVEVQQYKLGLLQRRQELDACLEANEFDYTQSDTSFEGVDLNIESADYVCNLCAGCELLCAH